MKEIELSVVGGGEDERFDSDIYESIKSLGNRLHRYGKDSMRLSKSDMRDVTTHMKAELAAIGQHMHGGYLPLTARPYIIDHPGCFSNMSLIGKYFVWYKTYFKNKKVWQDGMRIVTIPSPVGRYYVAIDDSPITVRILGKAHMVMIKSHCVMRVQQRLGLTEEEALGHIVQSVFYNPLQISEIGSKSIPFGKYIVENGYQTMLFDGSIKARTADIKVDSGLDDLRVRNFFLTVCYTYIYPEWEKDNSENNY